MPDEHITLRITPHPIRQVREYPLWVMLLLLSMSYLIEPNFFQVQFGQVFTENSKIMAIHDLLYRTHEVLPFSVIIILLAFLQALIRLQWKPFIGFIIYFFSLLMFCYKYDPITNLVYQVGVWTSLLMLGYKEFQRVSTQYFLTNRRLVLKHQGSGQTIRSVFLSNIQDVILQTSFLGNLLDYGTVVPLTASGIGTGQSTSSAGIQSSVGSKLSLGFKATQSEGAVNAQASPEYALVCIPNARETYRLILQASDPA